ncbi:hypothetical protein LWI28_004237 [Acer negundo]|uniref:Uncharacterized protein n=1 Tax=Acer negundo TaxID=4023 RepID=A0AAD5J419_ACENE|nr:hypothetical protein LWI28_004237 [Acer negundo]
MMMVHESISSLRVRLHFRPPAGLIFLVTMTLLAELLPPALEWPISSITRPISDSWRFLSFTRLPTRSRGTGFTRQCRRPANWIPLRIATASATIGLLSNKQGTRSSQQQLIFSSFL